MAWTTPITFSAGATLTAAQLNTHLRDNLSAIVENDSTDWDTWTPTLANLTLGNGTQVARFQQIAGVVFARWQLTLGTTSAVGTNPTVSTPVTATSTGYNITVPLGHCAFQDVGTATYVGFAAFASTTTFGLWVTGVGATYATRTSVTATVPYTFTTGDIIEFNVVYEAA